MFNYQVPANFRTLCTSLTPVGQKLQLNLHLRPPLYDRAPIHTLSSYWNFPPPFYNGQIIMHQGACCGEVQL